MLFSVLVRSGAAATSEPCLLTCIQSTLTKNPKTDHLNENAHGNSMQFTYSLIKATSISMKKLPMGSVFYNQSRQVPSVATLHMNYQIHFQPLSAMI